MICHPLWLTVTYIAASWSSADQRNEEWERSLEWSRFLSLVGQWTGHKEWNYLCHQLRLREQRRKEGSEQDTRNRTTLCHHRTMREQRRKQIMSSLHRKSRNVGMASVTHILRWLEKQERGRPSSLTFAELRQRVLLLSILEWVKEREERSYPIWDIPYTTWSYNWTTHIRYLRSHRMVNVECISEENLLNVYNTKWIKDSWEIQWNKIHWIMSATQEKTVYWPQLFRPGVKRRQTCWRGYTTRKTYSFLLYIFKKKKIL